MSAIAALDTGVLELLYSIRNADLVQIFIWISEFGRLSTVCGLMASVALFFILARKYAYAVGLVVSVVSSTVAIVALKEIVERARPPISFQAYTEIWYSFPSAHAALAAAFYGFLVYIAARSITNRTLKIIVITMCVALVLLVAFSRIYLGVHYMSDVVMGLLLGLASVSLGIKVSRRLPQ